MKTAKEIAQEIYDVFEEEFLHDTNLEKACVKANELRDEAKSLEKETEVDQMLLEVAREEMAQIMAEETTLPPLCRRQLFGVRNLS